VSREGNAGKTQIDKMLIMMEVIKIAERRSHGIADGRHSDGSPLRSTGLHQLFVAGPDAYDAYLIGRITLLSNMSGPLFNQGWLRTLRETGNRVPEWRWGMFGVPVTPIVGGVEIFVVRKLRLGRLSSQGLRFSVRKKPERGSLSHSHACHGL
jgi:hypothetical protein